MTSYWKVVNLKATSNAALGWTIFARWLWPSNVVIRLSTTRGSLSAKTYVPWIFKNCDAARCLNERQNWLSQITIKFRTMRKIRKRAVICHVQVLLWNQTVPNTRNGLYMANRSTGRTTRYWVLAVYISYLFLGSFCSWFFRFVFSQVVGTTALADENSSNDDNTRICASNADNRPT